MNSPPSSGAASSAAAVGGVFTHPLLEPNPNGSNTLKAFGNIFIAIVGAGVLGLPYIFMKAGWLTSLILIFSVASLSYRCMMLLILTRRHLQNNNPNNTNLNSFGDLGFAICGSSGRFAVDIMIVLTQSSFCIGYLIFISNTLKSTNYIWGLFPFQLGLNAIPSLTHLAPLSIFADLVQIIAMTDVIVNDVMVLSNGVNLPIENAIGGLSTFVYGLGVAMYSFEGAAMALPLEFEMKDKRKFSKVLAITIGLVSLLYGLFGIMSYFAFGAETRDIITTNMGNGITSIMIRLGLCVNLFFTLPLMMNPVYEVLERRFWNGEYCLWIRFLLVMLICLAASYIPNFSDFLSFVGSSICCVLGFVLPALFHYLAFKDEMDWRGALADATIVVLGITVCITGTWSSLSRSFS
ncbi:amino acid transporter AVT3C-like [Impatiens glandulifera]|uniref:amino acid transporter AVT3C-like n=1 Tax=Impatiens glandulifera TaxID=253017 RepID=UPI001FB0FD0C|nr:amino acid transporter AVT3C-like [Impatiens glandulifera]